MKYLFVIGHASINNDTTAHNLVKVAVDVLNANGHETQVIDLIKSGFDTVASINDFKDHGGSGRLDYISSERPDNLIDTITNLQKKFEWCDNVVIVAPIWYYRLPACVYAMIERVFTVGWAYGEREKLPCFGKHALIVSTAGGDHTFYKPDGECASIEALLFSVSYSFSEAGFDMHRTFSLYDVSPQQPPKPETIEAWKTTILNMRERELIPYGNFQGQNPMQYISKMDTLEQ